MEISYIFTRSKFIIKGVIYGFSTHLKTLRLAHQKTKNEVITYTSSSAWLIKNLNLKHLTNIGHIYKI